MKKNLFKLAGLVISAMLLGACSQLATFENEDLLVNQEAAAKNGFNLTPFGTGNENARAFVTSPDCSTAECLTKGEAVTFSKMYEQTIVTGSNAKKVVATVSLVIGTDNMAFYKIDYSSQRTAGNSNPDVLLYGTLNGSSFGSMVNAAGKWNTTNPVTGSFSTSSFDYSTIACGDTFSFSLTEVSNGNNASLSGTLTQLAYCDDDCLESFSYVDNGDLMPYTFTYVPAVNMAGAQLVFTFAQGVAVTGLDTWSTNGSTRQKTMDLVACQVYTWTVDLTPDCSGNSANNNVWTDFKVNSVSKKGTLSTITESCN